MAGEEVAIDAPISSGRAGHTTPSGTFHIEEKDRSHLSNIYGNYVDRSGGVVRSGISPRRSTPRPRARITWVRRCCGSCG